jgi:DNA helicase-2/ATP-dependent DNA helicase PcrA
MTYALNEAQLRAATSDRPRTFIEAGPGAGKTTIAAERFGLLKYGRTKATDPPIVALSFTNAATSVLRRTIAQRWGRSALGQRGVVRTIDSELVRTLEFLLRAKYITWPGGHTALDPDDSWAGTPAYKFRPENLRWRSFFAVGLKGKTVTAVSTTDKAATYGFTKTALLELLTAGQCTHNDVRTILEGALADPELRSVVVDHLRDTRSHLIVDEVFDANELDLTFVELHCAAGVPVTVVGDFWQALYEFRRATPKAVRNRVDALGFVTFSVLQSYRFETPATQRVATAARGHPAALPLATSPVEIVVAQFWWQLWNGPAWILPTSIGAVENQTDALITLLVDHLAQRQLGSAARNRADALRVLKIPADDSARWPDVLDEVLAVLTDDTTAGADVALKLLRSRAPDLGAPRAASVRGGKGEARSVNLMQQLARRVHQPNDFVEGVTVHQAKGDEWNYVGVCLNTNQEAALRRGLDENNEHHRILYVAVTRARKVICHVT